MFFEPWLPVTFPQTLTVEASLRANLGLLLNNANVASQIARAFARMEREGVS